MIVMLASLGLEQLSSHGNVLHALLDATGCRNAGVIDWERVNHLVSGSGSRRGGSPKSDNCSVSSSSSSCSNSSGGSGGHGEAGGWGIDAGNHHEDGEMEGGGVHAGLPTIPEELEEAPAEVLMDIIAFCSAHRFLRNLLRCARCLSLASCLPSTCS